MTLPALCPRCFFVLVCLVLGMALPATAQEMPGETQQPVTLPAVPAEPFSPEVLGGLDIEQLANIKVRIATRTPRELSRIPAAVSLLTAGDIRRDGALSIPEALRLVPGTQVARIDSGRYAVSIRGFNGEFANRLLVLQDRRPLYVPVFGGVIWEAQDTLLEDIEQIEIVRGPGAVLWGSNAVNGVINIETKNARDTQGWLLTGGGGNEEHAFGAVRYGGAWGETAHYRVWAKGFDRDNLGGGDESTGLRAGRVGFRSDATREGSGDKFMLSGEAHRTRGGRVMSLPQLQPPFVRERSGSVELAGGSVVGRWSRTLSRSSRVTTHVAYDQYEHDAKLPGFHAFLRMLDGDFQYDWRPTARHSLLMGAGYRHLWDRIRGSFRYEFVPERRQTYLASAFARDEIALIEDALWLTLAGKVEQNSFTGIEAQPDVHLAWALADRHLLWGAVSRPLRQPTRAESDSRVVLAVSPEGPLTVRAVGSSDLPSEPQMAYQLGYRAMFREVTTLDTAVFLSEYRNVIALGSPQLNTAVSPAELQARQAVAVHGRSYGGESSFEIPLGRRAFLRPGYSFLNIEMEPVRGATNLAAERDIEDGSPEHQFFLRGGWKFARPVRVDGGLFYIGDLPGLDIREYWDLHVRLAWRPAGPVEVSLAGRRLLGRSAEFAAFQSPALVPENQPSGHLKVEVNL